MDEFFQNGCSQETATPLQWFDDFLPLVNPSAFVKYVDQRVGGVGSKGDGSGSSRDGNANKRMVEFLGKMWKPALQTMQTAQERVHRHMINERMRRERQKQSYLALHRLLPLGTKGDKNTIIQMAAARIQELELCKEELMRRNSEIEMTLAASNNENNEGVSNKGKIISVKVAYPSSGIDSMLQVLECLKNSGTKLRSMHSNFSPQEFSALLEIEAKVCMGEGRLPCDFSQQRTTIR
ncbi:PREDICTED: transcription factor bHLH92 isoform X2 [Ipomoea nil]|uniref:transcription factor bHLH92 isoform X2 n=1 Tax=Ipomoea nil TaxID=35883 RepID=UPI000901DB83|nr:PREDICTED: transcription factor bHLH92 isoform X2 [Ipomoea nil]